MIIPKNGRVVIIDDNISEITGLMEILSKDGASFTYFSGSIETLPPPTEPLTDTTLVFLDLELDGSAQNDDVSQASQVISVLKRVLGSSAGDYSVVIVVWSGAINILKELRPRMPGAEIYPLALLEVEKATCKDAGGNFDIGLIERNINEKLNNLPALDLVNYWDNIVGQAANKVFKKILPGKQMDLAAINTRLNSVYKELAGAYIGKEVKKDHAYASLNMLNSILSNEIGKFSSNGFELDFDNIGPIETRELGQLNFSLHASPAPSALTPGCVMDNNGQYTIFAAEDTIKPDKWSDAVRTIPDLLEKMKPVLCEVTPLCDYAQKRYCFNRLLPGRLVPSSINKKWINSTDYFYQTPTFYKSDIISNDSFFIIFDLRRLCTVSTQDYRPTKMLFRFGDSLLIHLQNRLGRQVSNPGMVFVG